MNDEIKKYNFLYKLKKYILEVIISVIYFFKQGTKIFSTKYRETLAGNLDPFYYFGIAYFFQNIKNKEKMKKYLFIIIPLFLYAILQLIFIKNINILRVAINLIKISICIAVMLCVKENIQKLKFFKIIEIFTIINLIFIIISIIIGTNNFLWRTNDVFNKYSKTRLQLFFLEPSELGFHVAIILIFLLSTFVTNERNNIGIKKIIAYMLINSLALMLAQPMGAMGILVIAFFATILFEFIYNPKKRKAIIYLLILIAFIIICILLFRFETPLAKRVIDTINGKDPSSSYRLGVSFDVFKHSLKDYKFLGCGFGNINTNEFIAKYSNLHLNTVIANSFIYFFIETGALGISYIMLLIYALFRSCLRKKSPLNWGLLTFILIYQFMGSYFTNAINWVIYGIILSDFYEKDICKYK